MKQFVKVLNENPNGAYDYIANNYHKYSKGELTDIVKELLYAIHDKAKLEHDEIMASVAEELEFNYEDEE